MVGTTGQGPVQGVVVVVVVVVEGVVEVVVVSWDPPPHTSLPSRKAEIRLGVEEYPRTILMANVDPDEMA